MTRTKFLTVASTTLKKNAVLLLLLAFLPVAAGTRARGSTLVAARNRLYLLEAAVVLPGLYFSAGLAVALLQSAADSKRERAGNALFSGAVGWKIWMILAPVILSGFAIWVHSGFWWFTALALFSAVLCWPRSIHFRNGSLMQRTLLGGEISIPYTEISEIKYNRKQHSIIVTGSRGAKIVFSTFHSGRDQFANQLKSVAGPAVSLSSRAGFEPGG